MIRGISTIALILGVVSVAQANTLINFDDIAGSGVRAWQGDRYASSGVNFTSSGGLYTFDVSDTSSLPNWVYGSTTGGGSANGTVEATFDNLASFVSLFVYDSSGDVGVGTFTIEIFGDSNTLLETISSNLDRQTYSFTRNAADIRRVVFTASSNLEGIDDLEFNAVPAPGVATVLAAGVLLGARRRRA